MELKKPAAERARNKPATVKEGQKKLSVSAPKEENGKTSAEEKKISPFQGGKLSPAILRAGKNRRTDPVDKDGKITFNQRFCVCSVDFYSICC